MPLLLDEQERGMTSVHVAPHHKLVKHRTIIREAYDLISWLSDDSRILKIDLGRVSLRPANSSPELRHQLSGRLLKLLFVGNLGAQIIELRLHKSGLDEVEWLLDEIKDDWEDVLQSTD